MNWQRKCSSCDLRDGLAALVASWPGNGQNHSLSANEVLALFGNNSISDVAEQMNLDQISATSDLAGMIYELPDKLF